MRLRLINPGFVRTPLTDLNEFDMPFLMEVDDAARAMISRLEGGHFEITFPRRFYLDTEIPAHAALRYVPCPDP